MKNSFIDLRIADKINQSDQITMLIHLDKSKIFKTKKSKRQFMRDMKVSETNFNRSLSAINNQLHKLNNDLVIKYENGISMSEHSIAHESGKPFVQLPSHFLESANQFGITGSMLKALFYINSVAATNKDNSKEFKFEGSYETLLNSVNRILLNHDSSGISLFQLKEAIRKLQILKLISHRTLKTIKDKVTGWFKSRISFIFNTKQLAFILEDPPITSPPPEKKQEYEEWGLEDIDWWPSKK